MKPPLHSASSVPGVGRRDFLAGAAGGMSPVAFASIAPAGAATTSAQRPWEIVDTNISLFQWPFRRLPADTTVGMLRQLKSLGIDQAWAGSFEALLHRDVRGVNQRLHAACESSGRLIPFGTVNPLLPDWEEDIRHCHEDLKMPGLRLHPNYHGYRLEDPVFERLLRLSTDRGLLLQLASTMEDVRTQHPLVRVKDVDLSSLPELMKQIPPAKVQVLNLRPRAADLALLAKNDRICLDTARADSTRGVAGLLKAIPRERILFGSHAPFLIQQAAMIRVLESELSETDNRTLFEANARRLLKG
ncbi:MAG: amidohydrolase family protein [Verrucomicrobiia bacterium]